MGILLNALGRHMQKPLIDLGCKLLAHSPSKNYLFHLLARYIGEFKPAHSLEAGVGQLRNFWMYPNRYVGITHNRPEFFRGLKRSPNGRVIEKRGFPEVYLMRLESDFSFLGSFDLCVCTNTIDYINDHMDVLQRLSDRVGSGGSLLVEDTVGYVDTYRKALSRHYEQIDIVYWGFKECDQPQHFLYSATEVGPTPEFLELFKKEMDAPNIPDGHDRFFLIAQKKRSPAGPSAPRPDIIEDNGLLIVRRDIPHLKMSD